MICAIVLAAGCSRRMGTQKVLLTLGKETVISHIIDQLLASRVEKIYVVAGFHAEEIKKELSGKPISIVYNREYESGMLSSVRAGLSSIPNECEAVFVVLGDQPSISSKLIDEMIQSFFIKEKKIVVPLYDGKRGHPILFSIIYKNEILKKFNEVGLRGLMQAHDSDVYEMNVSDPSVLTDMDYPDDYKRQIEKYENRDEQ
jgi:molybdenum cofactor cytidylyltransferase